MKNRSITQGDDPKCVNVVTFFQRFVTRFEDRRRNFASLRARRAMYQSYS
jgi:hypothetical protein